MKGFVINLESATDRLEHMEREFGRTSFDLVRVPAVNGRLLPLPLSGYAELLYRWFHGRSTNLGEVGCYLSHLRAFDHFLRSDDEYALICEDDIVLGPDFEEVVEAALTHSADWDIVRLTGLGTGKGVPVRSFPSGHHLCVNFGRLKGAGVYLINREAARRLVKSLLPMRLPFDHAIDREWVYGLRAASVLPFPASQTDGCFRTSIQASKAGRLGWKYRVFTTYPYQAVNELSRYFFRSCHYLFMGGPIAPRRGPRSS